MSRSPILTALLDANVLYPAPLRDYILHLASLGVYVPLWTAAIQEEWIRNLLKARPDIPRTALEATQRSMDKAFPASNITGYESHIAEIYLPDPNDRHVLAAAIKAQAQLIVTANLKDFPSSALAPYSMRVEHPDMFVSACIDREKQKAIKALENQIKALKNPALPREKVLKNLEATGLIKSSAKLRSYYQS
ncbi:MAG TPA: PIN domain-containing protein [Puia sp.]|uniref:PIN domain-containing protein n=1 Tax=Puia sp. TaxID=2045100 RepID=UPI002C7FF6BB|nr:PIN domain-containing protein [Puia sp.]HVU96910.1 PIN domain-containing protein [Puia sp.]